MLYKRLLRALGRASHFNKASKRELKARLDSIDRAQALVEFQLDGTIVDANDNFLEIMGYTRNQIVGAHHRIFVSESERESAEYRQFWATLARGEKQSGVFQRFTRSGQEKWIRGDYSPIFDRRGRPRKVIKHARDVTVEQNESADMEGRLEAINRSEAVVSFSLDGIILDVNENFQRTVGYSADELIGQHHRMLVDPVERESQSYREFWRHLQDGEFHQGVFRRIHKSGHDIWIQANYNPIFDRAGRIVKVVKNAIDVTDRTNATRSMRQSLASMTDSVPAIASKAQNAREQSQESSQSAEKGGTLVGSLIELIASINERAQSMHGITNTMDGIAFQTNILALNASVEAANAGESGKGFGVVAQEVRSLAQRSADSAGEIRRLIGSINKAVADCSERADQAGEALQNIVRITEQVNDRVTNIASVAQNQADDVRQLNETLVDVAAGTDDQSETTHTAAQSTEHTAQDAATAD